MEPQIEIIEDLNIHPFNVETDIEINVDTLEEYDEEETKDIKEDDHIEFHQHESSDEEEISNTSTTYKKKKVDDEFEKFDDEEEFYAFIRKVLNFLVHYEFKNGTCDREMAYQSNHLLPGSNTFWITTRLPKDEPFFINTCLYFAHILINKQLSGLDIIRQKICSDVLDNKSTNRLFSMEFANVEHKDICQMANFVDIKISTFMRLLYHSDTFQTSDFFSFFISGGKLIEDFYCSESDFSGDYSSDYHQIVITHDMTFYTIRELVTLTEG